jgi:hypothetical protein
MGFVFPGVGFAMVDTTTSLHHWPIMTLSAFRQSAVAVSGHAVGPHMHDRSKLNPEGARPYLVVLMLAAIWIAAAALRPETTLHLGPVLLPLVPLLVIGRLTNALPSVLFGVFVGFTVLVILGVLGNLDGPALEPFDSAAEESVFALLAAGAAGVLFARLARQGVDHSV